MAAMNLVLFGLLSCVCLGSDVVANCSVSTTDLDQLTTACNLPDYVKVTSSSHSSAVVDNNNCNTLYTKGRFSAQPVVEYANAKEALMYTLVMIDPDAPNHPQGNYYLHWIVTNIPGSDLVAGKVDGGTVVASYRGPAPPKNTGDHRYLFLVFEQGGHQLNLTEPKRPQFNLASWAASAEPLCGPIAGAQFKAHF